MTRDFPVTQSLHEWQQKGDASARDQVMNQVYSRLRSMAAHMLAAERPGHTLQPTALVSELYLRLNSGSAPVWKDRNHFFAAASKALRQILIDHARAHRASRRGGQCLSISFDHANVSAPCSYDDLLIVEEALSQLEETQQRAARVTEMRFFGAMLESEIAAELSISEITVKRDWKFARAWLAIHLKSNR